MFINDAGQVVWGTVAVPDAVWIDHGDWTVHTHSETFDFTALNSANFGETEFLEARLEVIPRFCCDCAIAARLIRTPNAQENMASCMV